MSSWVVCFHIPDLALRALAPASDEKVIVSWAGRVWSWSEDLEEPRLQIGDSLQRALALCPDALLLNRDLHGEVVLQERLLRQLYTATPQVMSLGDSSLLGTWVLLQNPVAGRLRQLTRQLRARVGVAEHRSYAMLAAAKAASGQLLVLKPADLMSFLQETSVSVLLPLGYTAVVESLALFGLRCLFQVYDLTRRHLKAQFAEQGQSLYSLLHPDPAPPVPAYQPRTIQAGFELDAAILETLDLTPRLTHVVDQAVDQLHHQSARYLELQLYTEKGNIEACRLLKDPLSNRQRLLTLAQYLFAELMLKTERICGLSVILGGLIDTPYSQSSLFVQRQAAQKAIEAVKRRFPAKLLRGIIVDPQPIFHEEQTRFEPFT